MSTHPPTAFVSPRPAHPENEEPKSWTWTTPSPAPDDECPHGIADRAWCGFCSPAPRRHEARSGR
jgi:hypothetical protein